MRVIDELSKWWSPAFWCCVPNYFLTWTLLHQSPWPWGVHLAPIIADHDLIFPCLAAFRYTGACSTHLTLWASQLKMALQVIHIEMPEIFGGAMPSYNPGLIENSLLHPVGPKLVVHCAFVSTGCWSHLQHWLMISCLSLLPLDSWSLLYLRDPSKGVH